MLDQMNKTINTLVVGASPNSFRFSYRAAHLLREFSFPFVPISIKRGTLAGEEILDIRQKPDLKDIDTITLYIGTRNQEPWIDYLLSLNPKRIIFNPGTENQEFKKKADDLGIETVNGCTLIMLNSGEY